VIRLIHLEYWNRAWITQEVALVKRLKMLSGNQECALTPWELREEFGGDRTLPLIPTDSPMSVTVLHGVRGTVGRRLSSFVEALSGKECKIGRDRIFSLLALCQESECLPIQVDYSITDLQVLIDLIHCRQNSIYPTFCLCEVAIFASALGVTVDSARAEDQLSQKPTIYMRVSQRQYSFQRNGSCSIRDEKLPLTWSDKMVVICLRTLCWGHKGQLLYNPLERGFFLIKDTPEDEQLILFPMEIELVVKEGRQNLLVKLSIGSLLSILEYKKRWVLCSGTLSSDWALPCRT
jgi:hypothetical protein